MNTYMYVYIYTEYVHQIILEHKDDDDDRASRGNSVRSIYRTALHTHRPRPARATVNSNYYGSPPLLYVPFYSFPPIVTERSGNSVYLSLFLSLKLIITPQPQPLLSCYL